MLNIIKSEYVALSPSPHTQCLFRAIRMYYKCPKFRIVCKIRQIVNCKPFSAKRKNLSDKLMLKAGIEIGEGCVIGKGLQIPHFNGIVIGKNAVIGDNCVIYQQVTLGKKNGGYPVIGNNVVIYPGAKVIGDIFIGDGAVIGANAVVLKNVEANTIVAGCPSRVISG